jgi:hypothetical protein
METAFVARETEEGEPVTRLKWVYALGEAASEDGGEGRRMYRARCGRTLLHSFRFVSW